MIYSKFTKKKQSIRALSLLMRSSHLLFQFTELINSHLSSRLAPVPEESTDDMMFRSDVYDFPAIMGEFCLHKSNDANEELHSNGINFQDQSQWTRQ